MALTACTMLVTFGHLGLGTQRLQPRVHCHAALSLMNIASESHTGSYTRDHTEHTQGVIGLLQTMTSYRHSFVYEDTSRLVDAEDCLTVNKRLTIDPDIRGQSWGTLQVQDGDIKATAVVLKKNDSDPPLTSC